MPLGIFGLKFEKRNFIMFEISTLQFIKCKNLCKSKKLQIREQKVFLVFLACYFENILSYLKSVLASLPNYKVLKKRKRNKIWNQKWIIQVFFRGSFETIFSYLTSKLSNFYKCKVLRRNINPQIWDQKCLIWVFLEFNFEKLMSYLQSPYLNLSRFGSEIKICKFVTKNAFIGYFWAPFKKSKGKPSNFSKCKNCCKSNKTLLWYLKCIKQISNCKLLYKNKSTLNVGHKMPYMCVFQTTILKSIVRFENVGQKCIVWVCFRLQF